MCVVKVDATKFVGRFTIDSNNKELGVLVPDYEVGRVYTVPEGDVMFIPIYNGGEYGGGQSVSITFSNAVKLASTMAALTVIGAINLL